MSQAAQWTPSQDVLTHILSLFADVRGGVANQALVIEQLEQLRALPDYPLYIVYIIASHPTGDAASRLQACSQLQDYVAHCTVSADTLAFMKSQLTTVLGVVASVGPVFARIAIAERLNGWGPIFEHFYNLLSSPEPYNALKNLWYLIEDISCTQDSDDILETLESNALGRPMKHIIPQLIALTAAGHTHQTRVLALRTLLLLVDLQLPSVDDNLQPFLMCVFALADELKNPEAQYHVCQALSRLTALHLEVIMPFIDQVVRYMIICMAPDDNDERTRVGACDYWVQLLGCTAIMNGDMEPEEAEMRKRLFAPYLNEVVPLLVQYTQYSDEDLMEMSHKLHNDALEADDAQDIKPRHYNQAADDDLNEDDDDDDDETNGEDAEAMWTVRRACGRAVDSLGGIFPLEVMTVATPLLQVALHSQDWRVVEAALLVFGAIANGCHSHVAPTLPEIGPYIISLMSHEQVLVRSTSCWALSCYSNYLAADGTLFFPLLEAAVSRIQDGNKMVQHSACSLLATLIDSAGPAVTPYAVMLLEVMDRCASLYQTKNRALMFDALNSLADAVGPDATSPTMLPALMNSVVGAFRALPSDDYSVVDVCVYAITALNVVGGDCVDYAPQLAPLLVKTLSECYSRITELRNAYAGQGSAYSADQDDMDDVNRLAALLDATSALTGALKASAAALWSGTDIIGLVRAVLADPQTIVRVSALGLLGDVATHCGAEEMTGFMAEVMPRVVTNISLDPANTALSNNAAWVMGIAANRFGEAVFDRAALQKEAIPRLCGLLARSTDDEDGDQSNSAVHMTAASTLGWVGLLFPDLVLAVLPHIVAEWSYWLGQLPDKTGPMRGYFAVVGLAPDFMAQTDCFGLLARVLYAAHTVPELAEIVGQVLQAFQGLMGANWGPAWAGLPPQLTAALANQYSLTF